MFDIGVFDGVYIVVEGGLNVIMFLQGDNKFIVDKLILGIEYNFFVFVISGIKLSNMYYVFVVKICKYVRICISFFLVLILCIILNQQVKFILM